MNRYNSLSSFIFSLNLGWEFRIRCHLRLSVYVLKKIARFFRFAVFFKEKEN